MALWNGTAINTNETAMVFNQLANAKTVAMITKRNALLHAFLGDGDTSDGLYIRAQKNVKVTGKRLEVRLRGKNATPAYVADGSAELATVNYASTYDSTIFGAAEFDIAHGTLPYAIPASELMRFAGKEAKTASYLDEIFNYLMDGWENLLGNDLNGTSAPARTKFGGWQYAIDDSNTYGTIDRSDSANADFRGIVKASTGTPTVAKIQAAKNEAKTNRGKVQTGVASLVNYNYIQQQAQSFQQVIYNRDKAEFGSDSFVVAGVEFILDQRLGDTVIGLFDPETWLFWKDNSKQKPMTSGIYENPNLVDGYSMNTKLWIQNICIKPNSNVKFTGVTQN